MKVSRARLEEIEKENGTSRLRAERLLSTPDFVPPTLTGQDDRRLPRTISTGIRREAGGAPCPLCSKNATKVWIFDQVCYGSENSTPDYFMTRGIEFVCPKCGPNMTACKEGWQRGRPHLPGEE